MRKRPETEEEGEEEEELISKLPDDILVRVLSLLPAKEVIRCGALSRRWTTLPKLVPMALRFFRKYRAPSLTEETKFIHHINQVLDSYPGETLAELSISYELSQQPNLADICSQFDNWVRFAMGKKVGRFDLDLSVMGGISYDKYQFPPIPDDQNRSRSQDVMFTSLTHLRLHSVNVTDEHIEHFFKCCPLLESLCVIGSDSLTRVKVDAPIRLKLLHIRYCSNLQVFEISSPDLISFKYMPHPSLLPITSMPLKCAPQLNEMAVAGGFYDFLIDNFRLFTNYFARIETLSLGVVRSNSQEFHWPIGIPTLRNLKDLTVQAVILPNNNSLMCFAPWIEASPLLRRFVFKRRAMPCGIRRKAVKPRMCPHNLLKDVEFIGFTGDVMETELVTYIIENAVNLDKIVFDCRYPKSMETHIEDPESDTRSLARVRARKFQSKLSSAVEFVLIP